MKCGKIHIHEQEIRLQTRTNLLYYTCKHTWTH